RQQLVGEVRGSIRRSLDLLDVLLDRAPPIASCPRGCDSDLLLDKGGVIQDHPQQVVEVVGHTARQLTETLQTLGLLELSLKVLALADVTHESDESDLPGFGWLLGDDQLDWEARPVLTQAGERI